MSKFSRRLVLVAAMVSGLALAGCNKGGASGPAVGDMSMGDPNAPVKMVEYASVTCSHCARFGMEVFPEFKAKYVDTGQVYYTLKEFLTPPIEVATAGFLVARCAGEDKYFSVINTLFRTQGEMFASGDLRGGLLRVAQSAGMTEEQFNACIMDEEALVALDARVRQALRDDISATPTFVINGKRIKGGAATMAELDAAVAEALQ